MRCLYVDLDGTLLGPGGSLLLGGDGRFSALAVRALEACWRAEVEVVVYSGRKRSSVFESARLIGSSAYSFELGCGLVLDGELEWLTDGIEPSAEAGTIYEQIERSGAPALLLDGFADRLEYHTPWSVDRDVSHLFRGLVDLEEVGSALEAAGLGWLRLVDNGVVREHTGGLLQVGGRGGRAGARGGGPGGPGGRLPGARGGGPGGRLPGARGGGPGGRLPGAGTRYTGGGAVHAYHLVPAGASKARAVARHMQARGYRAEECVAVGDSREDMDASAVVGTFWLVANALEADPTLESELRPSPRVRVAEEGYGAGVYEAVITTLAEAREGSGR